MTKFVNKFKNLRINSGKFVSDFIKNGKRQVAALRRKPNTAVPAELLKNSWRYSVVSAVYNVSPYLNDFFKSLVGQSLDFRSRIEIVMVDDGSTDDSARIIKEWQRKYPKNIRYIRKENGGQASARNLGLQHITGRWVTFTDPDDFVSQSYFEEVDKVLAGSKAAPAMVSCNFIFYLEQGKRVSDTHPLKYRFAKGTQTVNFAKPTSHIQLSTNTVFFDAQVIERHYMRFDERIKPNFEDAHFVNSYLMHVADRSSVFCASAKYFYRKRSNGTSTLDTSWEKEGLYTDVLEHGVLALMHAWLERNGSVPVFVQRVALYHLIWYFKRLVNNDSRIAFLSEDLKARFVNLLHEIFSHIEVATIDKFDLAGIWFMHRVGLMAKFKGGEPDYQIVYLDSADLPRKLFKLRYFANSVGFESFKFDGVDIQPIFATSRIHTFASAPFVEERIVWLPLQQHATLSVEVGCKKTRISFNKKQHPSVALADVRAHFGSTAENLQRITGIWNKAIARLATTRIVQEKYREAWALMDRDVQADDNAEHLYRYLRNSRPEVNAYFVLRRSSHDWTRLGRDGFKLIPFGGIRHKLLMLNAKNLISSHIDQYIVGAVKKTVFGGRLNHRLVFLQHGVLEKDIADWLNSKDLDLFVTSAPRERDAIIKPGSRYKFSGREVVLTGLPRHDRLLSHTQSERIVLVMPTWRKSLTGASKPGTFERETNPAFTSSEYFKQWNALLQSKTLSALARKYDCKIVFYPHANMQPYAHLFHLPENGELRSHANGSIQDMFKSAALMITDYSSVAAEFAYMRRPLIYFQFDRTEAFGGAHIYQKGYFEYETDGFGPVFEHFKDVVTEVSAVLERGGVMAPEYLARAEAFLPLRDGRNCERMCEAIMALDRPTAASPMDVEDALEALEQAVAVAKWEAAAERAERILAMDAVTSDERAQAARRGSQAFRELGDVEAAQRVLESESLDVQNHVVVALELAEVASMRADWDEAAARWESVVGRLCDGMGDERELQVHAQNELIRALIQVQRETDALAVATQILGVSEEEGVVLPAFAEISRIALNMGDLALARRFALAVLSSRHVNVDAQCAGRASATLAAVFEQRDDLMAARAMWMRALRSDEHGETYPARFDALVDMQETWSADRWADAREASSMFVDSLDDAATNESAPELDVALTLCAMHRVLGETDAAAQLLGIVQLNHPNDVFVHLEAAELALAVGDQHRAEAQFAKARATPCGARIGRVARGVVIARQALGKLQGLHEIASTVIAQRTNDLPLARAYARVAVTESRWDEALDAWRMVIALSSPDGILADVEGLVGFAQALRALGRLDEAQEIVSTLLVKVPGNAAALGASAEFAIEQEDWPFAVATSGELEKIASSVQERRHASRMLSLALWWSGDEARARERLWREVEASAFTALANNDLDLAERYMSRIAFANAHGVSTRKAGDALQAKAARRASPPISVSVTDDENGLSSDFPRIDITFVDADGHA